jgi:hypothetical protein
MSSAGREADCTVWVPVLEKYRPCRNLRASQLAARTSEKSPTQEMTVMRPNSRDISKAFYQSGSWEFDPSQVSQPVRRSVTVCNLRLTGPEIPAFRAFAFVSGLPLCRGRGGNRQKSPAFSANIPVLGRLWAEISLIRTAAQLAVPFVSMLQAAATQPAVPIEAPLGVRKCSIASDG